MTRNAWLDPAVGGHETTAPGTGQASSEIRWPAGPHYWTLTASEGAVAWVRYRVWAADWHTRTLNELGGPQRSFDREVGIEMALDGALNGLSSAFDAGVALLIRTVEDSRQVEVDDRLPVYRHNWDRCRDMLKQADIANDDVWALMLRIDEAMEGESWREPSGWLARVRRLRNRVAHQDSLARRHAVGVGSPGATSLSINGRSIDAFVYLADLCDQLYDLTEHMIRVASSIGHRTSPTWHREPWAEIQKMSDQDSGKANE
jgi:hypothetical protein